VSGGEGVGLYLGGVLSRDAFVETVEAVHRLGCVHTSRDGFVSESVTGLDGEGRQVLAVTTQDVEEPSRFSDPRRGFLVVNQPLEEVSAFLTAGLALHQAQVVLWQGSRIVPSAAARGVLPGVCTVGVMRAGVGGVQRQARVSVVRSYGREGVLIESEEVDVDGFTGRGAGAGEKVSALRDRQFRRVALWLESLIPSLDVDSGL